MRQSPSGPPSHVLTNIALVPANLLPWRDRWQTLANALPGGSILVCLPVIDELHLGVWEDVVRSIRAKGHRVVIIPSERIRE